MDARQKLVLHLSHLTRHEHQADHVGHDDGGQEDVQELIQELQLDQRSRKDGQEVDAPHDLRKAEAKEVLCLLFTVEDYDDDRRDHEEH